MSILQGDVFDSFDSLKEKIKEIEDCTNAVFVIDSSKTIDSANKVIKDEQRFYNPIFKYRFIRFACKHYGNARTSTGPGRQRPNQASFKIGCPANISASVDRKKNKMVILDVCLEHNHELNPLITATYPEKRRLDENEKAMCATLLGLGVTPRKIQNFLSDVSGKPLTLRDIHNHIRLHALNKTKVEEVSDLQMLLTAVDNMLSSDSGSLALYNDVSEDNQLRLLFWQTTGMRELYAKFPEVLFVDGAYSVNAVQMPLLSLLVQDGYGNGRVCAYALIADETFQSIYTILDIFRQKNESSQTQLQTLIIDKNFPELSCFSDIFTSAKVQVCNLYVLNSLRTTIGNLQGVDKSVKDSMRDLVQKLVHVSNEDSFTKLYNELQNIAPYEFMDYFNNNWYVIRDKWVRSFCSHNFNLNNFTNGRVECHNQKIKPAVTLSTKLAILFQTLLSLETSESLDCSYQHAASVSKVRYHHNPNDNDQVALTISNICTSYSADLVLKQLNAALKCQNTVTVSVLDNEAYVTFATNNFFVINIEQMTCNCAFSQTMRLPCKHILLYRLHAGLALVNVDIIPLRWQKSYHEILTLNVTEVAAASRNMPVPRNSVLSKVDKYRLVSTLTKQLTNILCSAEHTEFVAKFELLENLVSQWSSNSTVAPVTLANIKSEFNLGPTAMETLDSLVDPAGSDTVIGTSDNNLEPYSDVISSAMPVISKPINSWPVVFQSNDSRLTKRRKFASKSTVMNRTKRTQRKRKNSANPEETGATELEKMANVVQESVIDSIIEGEPIVAAEPASAVSNDIFGVSSELVELVPKKRIVSILKTRQSDVDDSICYICMKRKPDSLQEKTRSVSWVACAERCGRLVHRQCLLQGFNICKFCYDEAVACYEEID